MYIDNAASTPVHEQVLHEMIPFFQDQFGNPSSIHRYGRFAQRAIQNARKQIAHLINSEPNEILLSSGGTESNNTAVAGVAHAAKGNHIVTSSIEHEAILEPCKKLEKEGFEITYIPVDNSGLVNSKDIEKSITPKTCLVSIMFANNEVGTIQPIQENMKQNIFHLQNIRNNLIAKVMNEIPLVTLNGHSDQRIANNAHFTFLGVNGEDLIIKLDENGIAASTGSACSVRVQKESHVLKAMGFSHDQIAGSLRLTVGISNTYSEIEKTVEILKKVVKELRAFSPLKEKYGF